ncbi:hypothetical protein SAMN04487895_104242 [Paenibacillus sophorae]|uniref:Uncharacterized protein n=1 Tax=Paenibacillus sophorae TaxID=1333845 RepID=A0A1H8L9A3_9BACL|nr:hypothetical protein [Paenibacillus sophorae]QWU17374.1 hypothetical protein KP014_09590 [Paenibacillus sophorae]SEO01760.1 hypothetical protein SAMN04487895_104242 [Paenibacillus sophorae]
MAIKLEKRFRLADVINKNNKYHLWITSVGVARQDLYFVNNQIARLIDTTERENFIYYAKMSIGHVNESLGLLKKAREKYQIIWNEFLKIKGFKDNYDELLELCEGESKGSFYRDVLFNARNNIFHYNKGNWIDQSKEYDFESTEKVLQSMYDENFYTGYKLGVMSGEHDFYFAEEIQINWLFELGKQYELSESELLYKISLITAKVMNILSLILYEFFARSSNLTSGFNIRYK